MNVLLDECVPRKFKKFISNHSVSTVPEMRWAGVKDNQLLVAAADQFDVLITVDKRMLTQQTPPLALPVIILAGKSTQLKHLKALVPELEKLLLSELNTEFYQISA